MVQLVQRIIDVVKGNKPKALVTCHGGATVTPRTSSISWLKPAAWTGTSVAPLQKGFPLKNRSRLRSESSSQSSWGSTEALRASPRGVIDLRAKPRFFRVSARAAPHRAQPPLQSYRIGLRHVVGIIGPMNTCPGGIRPKTKRRVSARNVMVST